MEKSKSKMMVELMAALVTFLVLHFALSKPKCLRDENGNIMDPVGGNRLKNFIGWIMAVIAKKRERSSFEAAKSLKEIESFHKPEPHDFFNESYYFNGCDNRSKDRVITRISRRGAKGDKTYVFLLLDLAGYGEFALEEDLVPAEMDKPNPSARGLSYSCIEPMKKWRLQFKGKLRRGCQTPEIVRSSEGEFVEVDLDLVYERDTPFFWYMRDDCAETLGKNLSQEPWGMQFVKVCLKRSKNHGHYEEYGRMKGTISVDKESPIQYDFGTFRDHSWDIRRWQAMDNLFILLLALETPLRIFGHEYHYLDVTLVSMPDNSSGVARYSTGYILPLEQSGAPVLAMTYGTSILDIPWKEGKDGVREPMPTTEIIFYVRPEPLQSGNSSAPPPVPVKVKMDGPIRRLMYYPDDGAFWVYEDSMNFEVTQGLSGQKVFGYGTRQSGFRIGSFDPSLGGCG